MSLLPVMICGAKGRMGQALCQLAEAEGVRVQAAVDVGDCIADNLPGCAVVIDFSFHAATPDLCAACVAAGVPLVMGTTGHTEAEAAAIRRASESVPVVWAGNYSIGVNLLFHLTETAARVLGSAYQPEITEVHHRHKKDAPSGTALDLLRAIQAAPAFASSPVLHGRSGETGARTDHEVGIHALRGGEVIGEHTVFFFGERDRIELTHRAGDRSIFAAGALRAARWAITRQPGLYSMRDVLGLSGG